MRNSSQKIKIKTILQRIGKKNGVPTYHLDRRWPSLFGVRFVDALEEAVCRGETTIRQTTAKTTAPRSVVNTGTHTDGTQTHYYLVPVYTNQHFTYKHPEVIVPLKSVIGANLVTAKLDYGDELRREQQQQQQKHGIFYVQTHALYVPDIYTHRTRTHTNTQTRTQT